MIELTTGVVFLMSSLYGSGQSNGQVLASNAGIPVQEATSTYVSSFPTNQKVMEAYLREEYADEPILVDIARCESNFRQFDTNGNVIRGIVNSSDVGVMQINEKYHANMAKKLGIDIYSVEGNVEYAKHLYKASGTDPWLSSSKCWSQNQVAVK